MARERRTKQAINQPKVWPVDLDQVRTLFSRGFTNLEVAEFYKVTERCVSKWVADHPEFAEAMRAGKAQADECVERALYARAMGSVVKETTEDDQAFSGHGIGKSACRKTTTKELPPDTTACIYWLKNRRPEKWRDRQEIELSGEVKLGDAVAAARKRLAEKRKGEND